MIKKTLFGLMWFVIIFIVSYIATGVIFVLSTAGAETNLAKYETALTFRNTYIVFFLIGSLILAIIGSVTGILPGMKRKHRVKKKSSVKKKARKRGKR